ncbi:hypothetical protein CL653_01160 [bacterium]|nr:hypothetical protein [bacterium]|tara:strand:- start:1227 stop:1565 length:339 start_codon:yes stop_codon:yes gene_type:complete
MKKIFSVLTLLLVGCELSEAEKASYHQPSLSVADTQPFDTTFRAYRTGGTQVSLGQRYFGRGWYGREHKHPVTDRAITIWLYHPDGRWGYSDNDVIHCRLHRVMHAPAFKCW